MRKKRFGRLLLMPKRRPFVASIRRQSGPCPRKKAAIAQRDRAACYELHARVREKLKENFRRMKLFGSEFGEPWLRFSWVISPHQEAAGATVAIVRTLSPR